MKDLNKQSLLTGYFARNKPRVQIKFATLSLPCFNYYYELFYQNKKKIITKEIEGLLKYESLSYWIMDDGSYTSSGGIRLSTEGYKEPELRLLVEAMRRRFPDKVFILYLA